MGIEDTFLFIGALVIFLFVIMFVVMLVDWDWFSHRGKA